MRRLGWGPLEKGLLSRHLADGPPVPCGRGSPGGYRTWLLSTADADSGPEPASPAASPEPADTPARRHAKRLFEAHPSGAPVAPWGSTGVVTCGW